MSEPAKAIAKEFILKHTPFGVDGLACQILTETIAAALQSATNEIAALRTDTEELTRELTKQLDANKAATERMACGHLSPDWVDIPGYCRTCAEVKSAYDLGVSDGIESVKMGRTNNE